MSAAYLGKNVKDGFQKQNLNWDDLRLFHAVAQQGGLTGAAQVAGSSVFLVHHLDALAGRDQPVALLTGAIFLNLSRHEADIGIRNRTPNQPGLVRKRIGAVNFAIYGARGYCAAHPAALTPARYQDCDWISLSATGQTGTSTDWLHQQISDRARLICATHQAMIAAAASGAGLGVLPRFIGATDTRLQACCNDIAA